MRFSRLLLLAAGGVVILLAAAIAVALSSTFQTWAVRRALAGQPGMRATIGEVSAGLGRVTLRDLRVETGGAIITVPALEADLPLLTAGLRRRFAVTRLAGQGWLVDLSSSGQAPGAATTPPGTPAAAETVAVRAFAGILALVALPGDVALDGVNLQGEIVLPASRGRVRLQATGGGFSPGREGKLAITAGAVLADPRVSAVGLQATLAGTMDSARTLGRVALKFDLTAKGAQFPAGVGLGGEFTAARVVDGESYEARVVTARDEILRLKAEFPRESARLSGTWKINMRDTDVTPFALGVALPVFAITGAGEYVGDAAFAALQANGRLAVTADRLEVYRPELAVMGEMRVEADFDVAERGGVFSVQRLAATVAAGQPVAKLGALQPFEFNPATGELKATDPARDLVGVSLLGVPVAWVRPFVKDFEVTGEAVRGEFVGFARGGGLGVRTTAPVAIGAVSVAQGARRLLEGVEVSFGTTVDYNPRGWQVEIDGFALRSAGATMLTLDAKAGRLAGAGESLKTTGRLTAKLPVALAQPIARGTLAVSGGDLAVTLAASLGVRQEVHAQIALQGLEAVVDAKVARLPALTADLRADIGPDGPITFSAPITVEVGDRKSDVALSGSIVAGKRFPGRIEARIASERLVVGDVQALAAALPAPKAEGVTATGAAGGENTPPWAGLDGTVTLQLRQVEYGDTFRASNVSGRIDLDAGKIKLDGVQGGLGESGRATVNGLLTFEAAEPSRYALAAEVALRDFDPGPLFQTAGRGTPAIVEGRFDCSSKLTSRAATLAGLAEEAGGELQLTSKGGVFRGLPANVGQAAASTGRVAGLLAAAGNAVSGLTGRKDPAALANKAQAVSEFTAGLNPITFDQLSVVLARQDARTIALRDFALIAPEMRLTGSGTMEHERGESLLHDALAMEFKLRARGRQGELLKYLGALEPAADDLGYAGCTVPVRIGGTLGQPDAGDLSARLAALAAEKAGVTDKASELFNKLIGGGGK